VLVSAREMKRRIDDVIADATAFLVAQAQQEGKKTFQTAAGEIRVTGGAGVDYDVEGLLDGLRKAGCPEHRLDELVTVEIRHTLNRSVLRQLTGANEAYRRAAAAAEVRVERPWRASVR